MEKRKAKILLYDLEVSREVVEGYRNGRDFNVVKTIRNQELMCFAYKWLGERAVKFVSMHDNDDDMTMTEKLWELLDEADIAVAHNANGFDNKMANRFFIKDGLPPVKPYKTVDTLSVARSQFKFPSNRLNDLCEFLGLGSKEKVTYADVETAFLAGDKGAERLMKKYNVKDVELLEKLYLELLPYIRNHPNLGDINQVDGICPKCESANLIKEGTHARRGGRVQSYSCGYCGGWCNEATIKKEGRTVNG